jgi:hypothetical protein
VRPGGEKDHNWEQACQRVDRTRLYEFSTTKVSALRLNRARKLLPVSRIPIVLEKARILDDREPMTVTVNPAPRSCQHHGVAHAARRVEPAVRRFECVGLRDRAPLPHAHRRDGP